MGKVILISGGSEGLGKEITRILSCNHTVTILSTSREKLEATAGEFQCGFEVCDVTNRDNVDACVSGAIQKHQRIDVLINNAGIHIGGPLESNSIEDIKRVVDVNVIGPMILTRAVVPQMKTQGEGIIINVVSQAGLYGKAERSIYHATKFAMTGFTKSLEMELASAGIRVIGLYPGHMKTKFFEKAGGQVDWENSIEPSEVAKLVEFIINSDPQTTFPEIGIKFLKDKAF